MPPPPVQGQYPTDSVGVALLGQGRGDDLVNDARKASLSRGTVGRSILIPIDGAA